MTRAIAALAMSAALAVATACTAGAEAPPPDASGPSRGPSPSEPAEPAEPAEQEPQPAPGGEDRQPGGDDHLGPADPRPDWLGTRVLPVRDDGLGEVQPTPAELVDRRLPPPPGGLPAPTADEWAVTIAPASDAVLARSTWHEQCPVGRDDLAHVTLTFWGFDERSHTGDLLLHRDVAEPVAEVFRQLYEARFPLEEVRITRSDELDAPPTGDGNATTGFVCRSTVQGSRWSDHAYGRAVDVNPFHNPYVRGEVVVPELASAYLDRDDHRPGMIQPGDEVVAAFAAIGWAWGGDWQSAKDWMHFSASGR